MKYYIISLILCLLSACSTVTPVKQKFPDVPKELLEKCPQLSTVEPGTTSITEMLKVVVKNYGLYYECSAKQDGWTDWYTEQKKIYEKVNK
jgi:hypothetical protein